MKKTLLIVLQVFFFCNVTFAKDLVISEHSDEYSNDVLNVVPIFDIQTTYCEGETPQQLPSVSLNGVTGIWIPSVIDTSFSASYIFIPNVGQDAEIFSLEVTVSSLIEPIFDPFNPIYLGDDVSFLPIVSTNGVSGTWFPFEISNTETTTYTFTPDQGQCATPTSITIVVIPIANPIAPSPQTFNSGSTLADIVITPANVLWYDTFEDALGDFNRLALSLPLENNKTYYAVNDDGEYRSQPFPVTVIVTLNTASFELQNLKFYPNPVSSVLSISNSFPIQSIEIYNLLGQRLINESHTSSEVNVNLSNLPSALYLVKIKSENEAKEFRIIKD
jgi:hypothetical protein